MRHLGLGISLFSLAAVLSTFVGFASTPDLSLGQPSFSVAYSKGAAADDAIFIKQVKAPLHEGEALPVEQPGPLQNASLSKRPPRLPEENLEFPKAGRGLLVNASYGSSNGVGK